MDINNNINESFTEELISRSTKLQYELLKKAIKILKPGHEIVYSTCSILKQENEENIKKILKDGNVEVVPIDDKITGNMPQLPVTVEGTICIIPNELYEGFFIAKLRKIK